MAALVMGEADAAELRGRLYLSDFIDPAAMACMEVLLEKTQGFRRVVELPDLLRAEGRLRRDGHPLTELAAWLPNLPVPAHPEAWATLVVAGSLSRMVQACGTRLVQATECPVGDRPEAARALTVAVAQRAAVHAGLRRWDGLPESWRDTVPARAAGDVATTDPELSRAEVPAPAADVLQREVLSGLLSAPVLLDRLSWLREEDFAAPAAREVYGCMRRLHDAARPVDLVTVAATVDARPPTPNEESSVQVVARLRPSDAFPATVPFLARRLVEETAVREVRSVGESLRDLATSPGPVVGVGRRLLVTALGQLDGLRPIAERVERSRISRAPAEDLVRDLHRLRDRSPREGPGRRAG